MKLFIWNEPYPVSYGQSMFLAVAETEEQAREIARTTAAITEYGTPWPDGRAGKNVKLGKPSRVLDLPCGEWHERSE